MGETKTPHFYDFGIFEPVTKPQNQLFLSLETPGHLKQFRQIPKHVTNKYMLANLKHFKVPYFDILRKDGHRKMMKIRPRNLQNLEYGTDLFLKT